MTAPTLGRGTDDNLDEFRKTKRILSTAFRTAINTYADESRISPDGTLLERAEEIINTVFDHNPARMRKEINELRLLRKGTSADNELATAVSVGNTLAHLAIANAISERSPLIRVGHLYLALVDLRKIHIYPWTE